MKRRSWINASTPEENVVVQHDATNNAALPLFLPSRSGSGEKQTN